MIQKGKKDQKRTKPSLFSYFKLICGIKTWRDAMHLEIGKHASLRLSFMKR